MTKHTPGPWTYGPCKQMGSIDGKARLVDRPGWFVSSENRRLDLAEVHCTASQNKDEQEANARLIAAAPELLAALEKLLHETDDGTQLCARCIVEQARSVIAKAKGEGIK